MKRFELTVLGEPVPQGRPRFKMVGKGHKKFPIVYDPKESKDWKAEIRYAAQKTVEANGFKMWKETPLVVDMWFFVPRPKSLPKRVLYPFKRPDLDNLEKAVLDALQGVVFDDDSRVVRKVSEKMFHPDGKVGVEIKIWSKDD